MDRPDSPSPQPGASPIKAFLIIFALIILTTAIFLMTANGEESPDATRSPSTNSTPDFSLTDEEAIARFEDLHELWLRAIQERDPSLLQFVFSPDSPSRRRAHAEISRLLKDQVVDGSVVRIARTEVAETSATTIQLVGTLLIRPCFLSEDGRDVTQGDALIRQEGEWILGLESGDWLIDDAFLTSDKVLKAGHASCNS